MLNDQESDYKTARCKERMTVFPTPNIRLAVFYHRVVYKLLAEAIADDVKLQLYPRIDCFHAEYSMVNVRSSTEPGFS